MLPLATLTTAEAVAVQPEVVFVTVTVYVSPVVTALASGLAMLVADKLVVAGIDSDHE
jgi:hypothetical protein